MTAVPSDTQQRARPDQLSLHVPRRSSTSDKQLAVPNSQRSTHELTTVEHLPT